VSVNLGLAGKVAAVTGGTEGIGRATVLKLVKEGAKVAFCARREDVLERFGAELSADGADVMPFIADASQRGAMEAFIEAVVERYGRVDILVNNAGGTAQGPFEAADDATWHYDLSVKLLAQVRAARAAIPHMRHHGGGRIINVAMSGAKQPPAASFPTSVSRAAGLAFTKALSQEVAADGILVNAVALGWIKSRLQAIRAERAGVSLDEHYAGLAARVPLGRLGEPEEAANVIVFLASSLASYVTGSCINVDGGHSGVL
jgi:NAD(P)-dependent dehydrogenase (short-subunit alcohol dehydrogenase family)